MVEKVSSFLDNCGKSICAGGFVFSKPELFQFTDEYTLKKSLELGLTGKKMENWGLFSTIGQIPKIVSISLAPKYTDYQRLKIKFIFEEWGNHEDFQKRIQSMKSTIIEGIKTFFRSVENHSHLIEYKIPEIKIEIFSCQSKKNIELAQLADVFAHVSKKIFHSNNSFSRGLHNSLISHFNLFDLFPNKKDIIEKGIFDLHKGITKDGVMREIDADFFMLGNNQTRSN